MSWAMPVHPASTREPVASGWKRTPLGHPADAAAEPAPRHPMSDSVTTSLIACMKTPFIKRELRSAVRPTLGLTEGVVARTARDRRNSCVTSAQLSARRREWSIEEHHEADTAS